MGGGRASTKLTFGSRGLARRAALALVAGSIRRGEAPVPPALALADRSLRIYRAAVGDSSPLRNAIDAGVASVLRAVSAGPARSHYALAVLHFVERLIGLSPPRAPGQRREPTTSGGDGAEFTAARKRAADCGTYGTPDDIADDMISDLLAAVRTSGRRSVDILDLSMEGGQFPLTLAAARRPSNLSARCYGMDRDPVALALARRLLAFSTAGCAPAAFTYRMSRRDSLLENMPSDWPARFSAIIGNPPWKAGNWSAADHIRERFSPFLVGRFDLYLAFILRAHELVQPGGFISMVVPSAFLFNMNAARVRQLLLDAYDVLALRIYPQRTFIEVPCVIPVAFLMRKRAEPSRAQTAVRTKIAYHAGPLGGLARPRDERRVRLAATWRKLDGCVFNPAVRGESLFLLDSLAETMLGDFGVLAAGGRLGRSAPKDAPFTFRGIHGRAIRPFHVCARRVTVYRRGETRFHRPLNRELLNARKVVFQDLRYMTHADRLVAAVAGPGDYPVSTAAMFVPRDGEFTEFFEALLNSAFANAWYKLRDVNRSIKLSHLHRLPVINDRDAWRRIGALSVRCRAIRSYYHRNLGWCMPRSEKEVLPARFSEQHGRLLEYQRQIDDEIARLFCLSTRQRRVIAELSAKRVF